MNKLFATLSVLMLIGCSSVSDSNSSGRDELKFVGIWGDSKDPGISDVDVSYVSIENNGNISEYYFYGDAVDVMTTATSQEKISLKLKKQEKIINSYIRLLKLYFP